MQILLDKGIDINFSAKRGYSAAFVAAQHNQLAALTILSAHGADLQQQKQYGPIHTAAYRGHINILKFILSQQYVNPKLQSSFDGTTALHSAVQGNHLEAVKLLLAQPAYSNATSMPTGQDGNTPLITLFKFKQDNRAIFNALMKQPWIDAKAKDNKGKSAYYYAKAAGLTSYLSQL